MQRENDEAILARLQELADAGKLTEYQVVEEAADPDSPFHAEIFAETDEEAAFERRLHLGRCMIGRYHREITVEGGGVTVRAVTRSFVRVPSQGTYEPPERAFADHREELRGRAITALKSFRRQYRLLGDDELVSMMTEVCSG